MPAKPDMQPDLLEFDDDLPALLERAGDYGVPAEAWPQTLADIADIIEAALRKGGFVPEDKRNAAAQYVTAALAEYLGARQIYLPRGDSLRTALEHLAIWHEWDGQSGTKDRLARRYRMSPRAIERIIARQAALHRRRFQGRLFE